MRAAAAATPHTCRRTRAGAAPRCPRREPPSACSAACSAACTLSTWGQLQPRWRRPRAPRPAAVHCSQRGELAAASWIPSGRRRNCTMTSTTSESLFERKKTRGEQSPRAVERTVRPHCQLFYLWWRGVGVILLGPPPPFLKPQVTRSESLSPFGPCTLKSARATPGSPDSQPARPVTHLWRF